jgi:hypothetical protein
VVREHETYRTDNQPEVPENLKDISFSQRMVYLDTFYL